MNKKPLPPKEYFHALMPYIKSGQWSVVRESLKKRREALGEQPELIKYK